MNANPTNPTDLLNPLAALISVNARMKLMGRSPLYPVILILLSLMPAILWRLVYAWLSQYAAIESSMIDAFTVYSIFCSTLFMQFYVPGLSLLMGMTIFSEEIENETVIYLLLRPVPRFILVLGKFLSYLAVSSGLLGVSLVMSYLIIGSTPGAGLITNQLDSLVKDWMVFTLGMAAYGAVMMLVGVFFKQRLLVGLLLMFVWDTTAAFLPGSAYQFTVRYYLFSIFSHADAQNTTQNLFDAMKQMLGMHPHASAFSAVLVLCLIVTACVALTTMIVKHRPLKLGQQEAD
ncbi:MAG: ABC transporter permease subunit [bacterium]|nr:ABC transporter permease subunit [bacterium]